MLLERAYRLGGGERERDRPRIPLGDLKKQKKLISRVSFNQTVTKILISSWPEYF